MSSEKNPILKFLWKLENTDKFFSIFCDFRLKNNNIFQQKRCNDCQNHQKATANFVNILYSAILATEFCRGILNMEHLCN